jgi:hypothetical protein
LTGNIMEQVVGTHNAAGLTYTATHGDGEISISPSPGLANTTSWNNASSQFFMMRGGAFYSDETSCRASQRSMVYNLNNVVNMTNGNVLVNSAFNFYDAGGAAGNYGACQNLILTFTSACDSPIRMAFSSSEVSNSNGTDCGTIPYDRMAVYNNNAASGATFLAFGLGSEPGVSTYTSTNNQNSITVHFQSDNTNYGDQAGWAAVVSNVYGECFSVTQRRDNCGGRGVRNFW